MARDGTVLPKTVYRLAVHEFDGPHQASAGAAVVLVTARVAKVDVGADEALLVAQQDHDLQPGESGRNRWHEAAQSAWQRADYQKTYVEPGHVAVVVVLRAS